MPAGQIVLDILLIAVAAVLARKLPLALIENFSLTVGILFAGSEIFTGAQVVANIEVQTVHEERQSASADFDGNVYHFVFDSFKGDWWEALVEDLDSENDFRDCIYFANARSNFLYTKMSMSSLTTGRIFDGTGSLEQ